ncbi:hypothetical protein [Paraburkholderia ginsengisoli]|uniref:Uncharacterized protein n=1 Tax=Paraburkholderia ginsengisoli TaxID=311231 RepID=A0A7T4N310_9BURK|nr:hypothetical protein [Paraburkholderia ginsengisoli]QQC64328.1 hypothetical protein I6I06_02180 [Paraburkholderia ginsengisoli]
MRTIGFDGGHSIYELGPAQDVVLFFECVKAYAEHDHPETDWSLLTDRLYRRYLRREELRPALGLMMQVQEIFALKPAKSAIEWNPNMLGDLQKSWLSSDQATLADVFERYFERFEKACNSAESFFESFSIYQPVRVVISDTPGFMRDKNKPLAEYDALEGKPFWLQ